ncbi:MAG: P-loop NTPase [Armatimonadetes bacterium]|nr:P-loop NTPase [Armatimonadota bacterium]
MEKASEAVVAETTVHDTLFDPKLLDLVPAKVAVANRVLPIGLSSDVLVCMAEEPDDPYLMSRLRFQLQRDVRLIPARPGFDRALEEAYGGDPCPETEDLVSAVTAPLEGVVRQRKGVSHRPWNAAPKVIAVTSGKGGVGKTTMTANLGIALARLGLTVGVIDCDFGLSNLHVMLGMRPVHKLPDVLSGRVPLHDGFEPGPEGLRVLAGATGSPELAELTYARLSRGGVSTENLKRIFDIVFLDTGAGIARGALSMLTNADEALLVVTPDPSSVQDAYVTLRVLTERKPMMRVGFVVNDVKDSSQASDVAAKFQTFSALHLGCQLRYLGSVSHDHAVEKATRSRSPVVQSAPKSRAARDIEALAYRFSGIPNERLNLFQRIVEKLDFA